MTSVPHPLCPLTGDEIQSTARLIESVWPGSVSLSFKVITLSEPPKEKLAPYLQALDNGQAPSSLERRVFVAIESNAKLGQNVHSNAVYDEVQQVEKIALEDPKVLAELEKLKLP
ncbi:unnamed protein product, partial [Fusarium langsethiae]